MTAADTLGYPNGWEDHCPTCGQKFPVLHGSHPTWVACTPPPPFTPDQVDAAVEQAMIEIEDDISDGTVPADVPDFSSLHDYVDANCYGGLCDGEDGPWHYLWAIRDANDSPAIIDFGNAVQSRVDAWLRAGRPQKEGTP